MPNKVCRFALLFALGVLVSFVYGYVSVRLVGCHKMGWTARFILALLWATLRAKYPVRAKDLPVTGYEHYDPAVNAVARPVQMEVNGKVNNPIGYPQVMIHPEFFTCICTLA